VNACHHVIAQSMLILYRALLVAAALNGAGLFMLGMLNAAVSELGSPYKLGGLWLLLSGALLAGFAIQSFRRTLGRREGAAASETEN